MGKTKRRGVKNTETSSDGATREDHGSDKKTSHDKGDLYSSYKYCTEAVKQWGITTYHTKVNKKKATSSKESATSLTSVIGSLQAVVHAGIPMPPTTLRQLRTAIAFRQKVSACYRAVPSASELDHARHQWIIDQLQTVERLFTKLATHQEGTDEEEVPKGFAALSVCDDEVEGGYEHPETPQPRKDAFTLSAPQTQEEILAEERCFALACVLLEITEARSDLHDLWSNWALQQPHQDDDIDAAGELLAATACTEYAVQSLRKLVLQTSIEFHSVDDFDQILAAFGETSLSSSTPNEEQALILIKPDNLTSSDDTFLRLHQIYNALRAFDFDSVPSPPKRVFGSTSDEIRAAFAAVATSGEIFYRALETENYVSFLELTTRYFLPIWISAAECEPNAGAAEIVLRAYLREFAETRKIQFHLAFALLVTLDCAFTVFDAQRVEAPREVGDLFIRVLGDVCPAATYTKGIELFNHHNRNSSGLKSRYDFIRQYLSSFYPAMCLFVPWLSGELLFSGFRLNLECSSSFIYQFQNEYLSLIHVYWMLRSEGYIGCLPEIENTVIRMYRRSTWFRCGLPGKGCGMYLKSWQISAGASIQKVQTLEGKKASNRAGISKKEDRPGFHVTEISRLMDILQWKSMPFLDRTVCFEQISSIAKEECRSLFTPQLMEVCIKLSELEDMLSHNFVRTARKFCMRCVKHFHLQSQLIDIGVVCSWALALADNRGTEDEKRIGLSLVAKSFTDVFKEEGTATEEEPRLTFNSNDHKVDPSLIWGKEVKAEHSLV